MLPRRLTGGDGEVMEYAHPCLVFIDPKITSPRRKSRSVNIMVVPPLGNTKTLGKEVSTQQISSTYWLLPWKRL